MAEPFLGEIRLVSFDFPPKGWAYAAGQILPINQNQALFSLLGTTYGGDGIRTFALPDLQGRSVAHISGDITLGEKLGTESETLQLNELPSHGHTLLAGSGLGTTGTATNAFFAAAPIGLGNTYSSAAGNTTMSPASQSPVGGSQAHENRMPSLVTNYIIALVGIFPSRN